MLAVLFFLYGKDYVEAYMNRALWWRLTRRGATAANIVYRAFVHLNPAFLFPATRNEEIPLSSWMQIVLLFAESPTKLDERGEVFLSIWKLQIELTNSRL